MNTETLRRMTPDEIGAAYDRIAAEFQAARSGQTGMPYLERFLQLLPAGGAVLDVGCGTGLPITRILVERGFAVHGLDCSGTMLEHARVNVPGAELFHGDIVRWEPRRDYDGVVAWDSVFHLAPDEHGPVLSKIARMLRPGGAALVTCGVEPGEINGVMFGREFYYGSISLDGYLLAIAASGCTVRFWEVDEPGEHGHAVICFQKPSADFSAERTRP